MIKAKLTQIGNSVGIVLPKEALDHLKVRKGDTLVLSKTAAGYQLQPASDGFEAAMKAYERTRRKYRNALRELAK